jgi:short-subunit dehydrogenase
VNSDDSAKSCVAALHDRTEGKIDVPMNNAGFGQMGGIEEVPLEQAKSQLETNLWGYVKMAKTVLKIIEAPKPKLHYALGINKSALWLLKLLPKSIVENQTRRMFDVER